MVSGVQLSSGVNYFGRNVITNCRLKNVAYQIAITHHLLQFLAKLTNVKAAVTLDLLTYSGLAGASL